MIAFMLMLARKVIEDVDPDNETQLVNKTVIMVSVSDIIVFVDCVICFAVAVGILGCCLGWDYLVWHQSVSNEHNKTIDYFCIHRQK